MEKVKIRQFPPTKMKLNIWWKFVHRKSRYCQNHQNGVTSSFPKMVIRWKKKKILVLNYQNSWFKLLPKLKKSTFLELDLFWISESDWAFSFTVWMGTYNFKKIHLKNFFLFVDKNTITVVKVDKQYTHSLIWAQFQLLNSSSEIYPSQKKIHAPSG